MSKMTKKKTKKFYQMEQAQALVDIQKYLLQEAEKKLEAVTKK